MGFKSSNLFLILTLIISASNSNVNSQIQGCSLAGLDLQHCLSPSTQTPITLDSCCATLNQAVQTGYHCLCTLLGPSNYPFFSSAIALSFANCFISVPPLTHCQVLEGYPMITPPLPPVPVVYEPPPPRLVHPVLMPPEEPKGDLFVPLPPKVDEIPVSTTRDNSTVVGGELRPLPKLSRPKHWNHMKSDGGNDKKLRLHSRIFFIVVALYAYVLLHKNPV